ncbi:protein PHLOEM PROTEIN 2-LIKE A9-like isoform X1 [Lycium barbarum]|uniref:protein PHLOEM PROTEIN 2-LIKE A9-like isoform X1 n=1 Tax=Lycium barbarum TaxID=112863 RepID=UPI00293E569E|nr:protein PHLOEM PROTEIN 2-LIKE A9-like isoform X1 [Lycium barbarum]
MDTNVHFEGNHRPKKVQNGFEIYPSALNIIWGKDARYWKLPEGTFDPATLVQVSWLEVTGWCDKVEKGTKYDVKFELKLTPDAFGFNELPLYFMVKSGKKSIWKKLYLTKDANVEPNNVSYLVPKNLTITTDDSTFEDNKLCFGLYEVWSGKWKGGLIIQKVHIQKM